MTNDSVTNLCESEPMFKIEDRVGEVLHLVFLDEDPTADGYTGVVEEGASLHYDILKNAVWPVGADRPGPRCVGRDSSNPKNYKVFKGRNECHEEGFECIEGVAIHHRSWSQYKSS